MLKIKKHGNNKNIKLFIISLIIVCEPAYGWWVFYDPYMENIIGLWAIIFGINMLITGCMFSLKKFEQQDSFHKYIRLWLSFIMLMILLNLIMKGTDWLLLNIYAAFLVAISALGPAYYQNHFSNKSSNYLFIYFAFCIVPFVMYVVYICSLFLWIYGKYTAS